jgi:CheY-like chemotaxis protein
MDQETFARQVEDALAHIFDHFYLQLHPLSGLLAASAPAALRGRALSRLLVEAIERLKPGPDVPPGSPAWRKYSYLSLRYVQGLAPEQVSRQLGISDRQGRRDHRQALAALCALLWDDYRAQGDPPAAAADAETGGSDVETEILRLGRSAPRAACQIAEVVAGALETTAPLLARQHCQVAADLPPDLPPVAINPLIFREVVIALITWAADLGRGRLLRIAAAPAGAWNVLTVHCPAARAAVDQRDGGLLTTARRLAEMQGARLSVGSDPTDGTLRLTLDLPVAEQATVLVIDDNPDVVLLFRRYLGQTYRLVQACTAEEALALAEELQPALITLDVMMPGLDGWQILARLRRHPRTAAIPVIVCSILPEPSLALALGAVGYLPKPINPLVLRALLDRQLAPPRPASPP